MTQLKLPEGGRAATLLDELDRCYRQFASRLPRPLAELAGLRRTYHGGSGGAPFEGVKGLNPVLVATPWLLWELFESLEDARLLQVAEAGMLYVLASVVLDHLVDGQVDSPSHTALLHQALYENGVAGYRSALHAHSAFWSHYDRLAAQHLAGLAAEMAAQSDPRGFTHQALATSAHGKVSPIVLTVAALAAASGQMYLLEPLESSLDEIAVASQLLDDIGDWQADLESGHLTYYLAGLAPADAWAAPEWPSRDALQARIDAKWADVDALLEVMGGLDRSLAAVAGLHCPAWVEYVQGYRARTDQHLTNYILRHLSRVLTKT